MSVYRKMMTDDQKMDGLKASHAILSKKIETELERLRDFAQSFLNPERNGYAVTKEIRNQARIALGGKPVE